MCSGIGAPSALADEAGETPLGADQRERHPSADPDGLGGRDRARRDDVDRPVEPARRRGDDGGGRVLVVDHRERRVGQQADGHDREAKQPAERAGHVRADDRCQPHGRERHLCGRRGLPPDLLGLEERATEGGGRIGWHGLVRAGRRTPAAAVDGDAGPDDHVLERRALGGRPQHADGSRVRPLRGVAGVGAGVGLPDGDVDDDVGIEVTDDADHLPAVPWLDPVEGGRAQAAAGRIDVETGDLARPALLLEQRGDERAELAPHAAHQDALSAAHRAVTVARDRLRGRRPGVIG